MSFLIPAALLGLLTIPIILALHLLHTRRKQVAISSLRLWRELQRQKQGNLPRSIPPSLMLFLQLLIALFLTLALARPALSFLLDQPRQLIFVLDMTTSMAAVDVPQTGATSEPIRRFDIARQEIRAYIEAMDANDSVAVIGLTHRPKLLLAGNIEQREANLSILENLVPGATDINLSEALALANGLVDPEQENRIVVLTDGDYSVDSQLLPAVLAPIDWRMIPASPSDNSNQTLLNVSNRRLPDGRHRIFARIVNYSDSPVVRTVKLSTEKETVAEDSVEIDAQADTSRVWTLPAETETATVEIVEADNLPMDNRAELLLLGTTRRRVLLISETSETLARALEAQPGVELEVHSPNNLSKNDFANFDLIVFENLPPEQTEWPQGNVLVINPPLGHPLLPADNFARDLRPDPETASPLLTGIDLSGVFFSRTPRLVIPDWAQVDLMTTPDEFGETLPLIFHGTVGKSQIMVWGFDLNASNLPARLALPLLTANTLSTMLAPSPLDSVPVGEPILLANNYSIEPPDGRRLVLGAGPSNSSESVFSQTEQPGLYRIYDENNTVVAGFAVHAGSPSESNLTRQFQPDSLPALDAAALSAPDLEIAYDDFWPLLAVLALVVVTFEGWLAWHK